VKNNFVLPVSIRAWLWYLEFLELVGIVKNVSIFRLIVLLLFVFTMTLLALYCFIFRNWNFEWTKVSNKNVLLTWYDRLWAEFVCTSKLFFSGPLGLTCWFVYLIFYFDIILRKNSVTALSLFRSKAGSSWRAFEIYFVFDLIVSYFVNFLFFYSDF